MSDDDAIERCAKLCDDMLLELAALKKKARTKRYDRQTPLHIDYAIRAVRRVAVRVRAMKGINAEPDESAQ